MKRMLLFLVVFSVACGGSKNESQTGVQQHSNTETIAHVAIDSLFDNVAKFENQLVRVSGTVEHVCVHSGQRITLVGGSTRVSFKVSATQTIPRFDASLNGAVVEVVGLVKRNTNPNGVCEAESAHHLAEAYYIECRTLKLK